MNGSFFLLLVLFAIAANAFHPLNSMSLHHLKNLAKEEAAKSPSVPEHYYAQTLDHFNHQDQRTWNQRYFTNNSFWAPEQNAPIFIQIGGEGAISPAYVLDDFQMVIYAEKHAALIVALEHRFYGKSQPFDGDLSTGNLQYLTSEQALADLAQFIDWIVQTWDGVSEHTQFVTFGCSYPGNLAAWFRQKYPHLTTGSIAGSAPVHAVLDFFQYLDVVDESLSAFTGIECDARINEATTLIESMLQSPSGIDQLLNDFRVCGNFTSDNDITNFMSSLMGHWMGTVQYNDENGNPIDINYLCGIMNEPSLSAYDAYVQVNDVFLPEGECMNVSYESFIQELSIERGLPFGVGFRQWTYQTCFEFGYFQTTDSPSTAQPFGTLVPISFYLQMCNDVFSPNGEIVMNPGANVNQTNVIYGGNEPHGMTNVVFANGSIDPWHSLSIINNLNDSVEAVFILGTAHCACTIPYVAGQYPVSLAAAQTEINAIIGQWLIQGNQ